MKKEGYRYQRALTDKQKELLPYLAQDKTDGEIATALNVSIHVVKERRERIMDNTVCLDKAELVAYAREYMQKEQEA